MKEIEKGLTWWDVYEIINTQEEAKRQAKEEAKRQAKEEAQTETQEETQGQVQNISTTTSEILDKTDTITDLFENYSKIFINHRVNRLEVRDLRKWFPDEKVKCEGDILDALKPELSLNEKMELTRVYLKALKKKDFDKFNEKIRNKISKIVINFLSLVTEKDSEWKILFKASKLISWEIDIELSKFEELQESINELLTYDIVIEGLEEAS